MGEKEVELVEKTTVSKATLGRLPEYLRTLRDLAPEDGTHISATAIAKKLSLGEVQVRKDLAAVSGAGKPKLGYEIGELIEEIEHFLGYDQLTPAILVGAGKLGKALLQYREFERYGVKISAAFDLNEKPIIIGEKTEVLPMSQLESFCRDGHIRLGIITVGEGSAQEVCDRMVGCGIEAIWNFAPCKLSVPSGVLLQNENLALSLAHLNNQLCNHN